MTATQLKMARAALGLTVIQAARLADVSHETIARIEAGREDLKEKTIAKVRAALEAAGVIFIEGNGEGPGVKLKKGKGK
jgi:predicted transcriptional regulator